MTEYHSHLCGINIPKLTRFEFIEFMANLQLKSLSLENMATMIEYIDEWEERPFAELSLQEQKQLLIETLTEYYKGINNGFLSDVYYMLTRKRVEIIGESEPRYLCQCCGFYSLSDNEGWAICQYCHWEDVGDIDENQHCGCNKGSIKEYREYIKANPNLYDRAMYRHDKSVNKFNFE